MAAKKIATVVNDADMTTAVLASGVKRISEGIKKLRAGKLNDDTLVLLIQHAAPSMVNSRRDRAPVSIKAIRAVLDGLENLAAAHPKQPAGK